MVLASEPVGGRSRATELPCFYFECSICKYVGVKAMNFTISKCVCTSGNQDGHVEAKVMGAYAK